MYGSDIEYERLVLTADTAKYVSGFSCGIDTIDLAEYLTSDALQDEEAVTYLYVNSKTNETVAFASLSCTLLTKGENRTASPAILIDKFAVNEAYQHMQYDPNESYTLSQVIFTHMVEMINAMACKNIGATYAVLYATPEAHNFYKRCDFEDFEPYMVPVNNPEVEDCVPMYYRLDIQREP